MKSQRERPTKHPTRTPKVLTAQSVERIAPGPARIEVRDALVPGLRLIIQSTGARSWAVRYSLNGRRHKHTLAPYPRLGLADAREAARAALKEVARGNDPSRAADASLTAAVALYKEKHVAKLRPTTAQYIRRELDHAVKHWPGKELADISRRDVIALVDQIERRGVSARNTALKVLGAFFKFCEGRDLIAVSPARGVKRIATSERERVLSDSELTAVWNAADKINGPFGAFTKLLILTGARRNEIAKLEWSEVGADVIELPAAKVKTAMRLRIPLTATMRAVLDSLPKSGRFVLCGNHSLHVSGMAAEILKVELSEHWTWHDLRRSFASGLQRLGIRFEVIEAALNHKVKGIAGTYQKYDFEPEIKTALERWSKHIELIAATS
jgi:integrase